MGYFSLIVLEMQFTRDNQNMVQAEALSDKFTI